MANALGNKGEGVNRFLSRLFRPWNAFYAALERGYEASLAVVLRHPKTWVLLITSVTIGGFAFLAPKVK